MLRRSLIQSKKLLGELATNGNTRAIGSLPQADYVCVRLSQFSLVEMIRESTSLLKAAPIHAARFCSPDDIDQRVSIHGSSTTNIKDRKISLNSVHVASTSSMSDMIQTWNKIESPGYLGFIVDSRVDPGCTRDLCWRADSVRRKRKKKMNKHKHAKRRKLTRHKK